MIIKDIETELFNRIIKDLKSDQWLVIEEYEGIDAWIDYGMLVMVKGLFKPKRLILEWTNWEEGSIEGPDDIVKEIAGKYGLSNP